MRRTLGLAAAAAALAATHLVVPVATATPADDGGVVSDPTLVERIEAAPSGSSRVVVEVVATDTDAAKRAAVALGAIVTGSVPGEVVQVSIPAAKVDDLAATGPVEFVRTPLVANRPVTGLVEFGAVTGENIAVTNADAWHDAGIVGGVKVGIVDFFDLDRWNVVEHGPVPDLTHQFCLETSGLGYCPGDVDDGVDSSGSGTEHGIAVAEVVKDMAPAAELYLATVGTAADLRAAIDWFATNGVSIITRSLGAAYDGPGDGSGPLAAVVDHAAARGITWFNSAGNDARGFYGRYANGVDASGYVDFLAGPGVDTSLYIDANASGCVGFDGIRWSDWGKPASQVTDYSIEVYSGFGVLLEVVDAAQTAGAPPLEITDLFGCSGDLQLRIRRKVISADPSLDTIEVGLFVGAPSAALEYHQAAGSAAKPVVDSRNPALVAVGAVEHTSLSAIPTIASYSSQGPTNDGRIKPDMSAPTCVKSSIYDADAGVACFDGTSAASPSAAGAAALLLSRGLAVPGAHLAGLTRHLVADLGPAGDDNAYGSGELLLPAPPVPAIDTSPTQYVPLATPTRILDTRPESATPGADVGPHPQYSVIDLPITGAAAGATAVAVSIVSTDSVAPGYVQALPTLMGQIATSSNLNVATPGQIQPNFAVVPVGVDTDPTTPNSISFYLFAGGNVVVDLMGWFTPAPPATPVDSGRFVAVDPVRVLDTRPESGGPVPPEWVPHKPLAGETVRVTGIPAGASAAVVNVVADQAVGPGYLRAQPTGATGLTTSNGNYVAGLASGTLSIVPVGTDGTISVFTSNSTHIVVDLMGFVTGIGGTPSRAGLYVPLGPTRAYDSRTGPGIHETFTSRVVQITGVAGIPAGALAVSMNLTSDAAANAGYLTVHPADRDLPLISNLNYPALSPRANAGMVRLSALGQLNTFVNQTTHVIIDVNGYFTGS